MQLSEGHSGELQVAAHCKNCMWSCMCLCCSCLWASVNWLSWHCPKSGHVWQSIRWQNELTLEQLTHCCTNLWRRLRTIMLVCIARRSWLNW